jgi:hypothetical protein
VWQDGAWAPVDYTLHKVDGGWAPKASPVPLVFSAGGGTVAVTLGSGADQVTQSWTATLPTPKVSGATATYDVGHGQSLVLTATAMGFEQSLVLAHAPASAPTVALPFSSPHLSMGGDGSGGFAFTDGSGAPVWRVAPPVMFDSASVTGPGSIAGMGGAGLPQRVPTTLSGGSGHSPRLSMVPPMSWLTAPSTVYPVRIDPSITVAHVGDTFVQDNISTGEGASVTVHAGEYNGHAARAYEVFSGLTSLAGDDVTAATCSCTTTTRTRARRRRCTCIR